MKIFEVVEFVDGGPNDRGTVIGYVQSERTEKELSSAYIRYNEVSEEYYNRRMDYFRTMLELPQI